MRVLTILLFVLAFERSSGQVFPTLSGETLAGEKIRLPVDNGKKSIIGIAFHKDAEDALKTWLTPLYETFIKKEGGDPFDMSEWYDVNFSFIPLIHGFSKVAEEFRRNTDKEFWPYIVDAGKHDINAIKEPLQISNEKTPWFFVLDKDGKVLARVNGIFSETKLKKLEDAAE